MFTLSDGFHPPLAGSAVGSTSAEAKTALPRIRLHDIRHSYATAALVAQVAPKVVSERLGHNNVRTTLDTYSHVLPTMQDEAAATVAALVLNHCRLSGPG